MNKEKIQTIFGAGVIIAIIMLLITNPMILIGGFLIYLFFKMI